MARATGVTLMFHAPRLAFTTAGVLLGCGEPIPLCDICTTSAVVYGAVHSQASEGVEGALVTVTLFRETCEGGETIPGLGPVELTTDATGSYREHLISGTG